MYDKEEPPDDLEFNNFENSLEDEPLQVHLQENDVSRSTTRTRLLQDYFYTLLNIDNFS